MAVLNITDIESEEYRVFRVVENGVVHVYASIGLQVRTAEGRDFRRDRTVELPLGPIRTRANTLKTDIIDLCRPEEGL